MSSHFYNKAEDSAVLSSQGSTSFHYSFTFLSREERHAINAVYAFCRRIDDIVDEEVAATPIEVQLKLDRLNWWRLEINNVYDGSSTSKLVAPLAQVVQRFGIPKQYLLTLIDGCERDLYQKRYKTFGELKEYCYAVASIVGLICIEIFGYKHEETRNYAINLGYALQLTNILRDVKADKDRGFIYLPLEDLDRFKYSESDLKSEIYNERFVDLMSFQASRAREYYHKARTLLRPDERSSMVAAEIMDAIYHRLLEKIELSEFRVFNRRVRVSTSHKVLTAFRIWLGNKLFVRRMIG
ncbi:MAG: presqualene diphosphate synthase HpnD [Ignavibacteria bacterium]|nr:presqualene diphosphate synthase HpnD [Ignavibacteria bacterium]